MNDKTLSIIIKAQDHSSKVMESISDKLQSVGRIAAKVTAAGLAAATAATTALGISAIKSAGDYEQSRIAFDTMLGSAEKAQALMTEIADFAKSTPFELPEIVNASKSLLAFGVTAKDIIPTMRRLGDVSAGLNIPVGELSELYGKAKVQGRLFMEDINQLTGRGIPIYQALAKVTGEVEGKIRDMVSEGKIGFPELEKAFVVMTESGSQFGGMMDKQSKSFNGVMSNIKDSFGQMMRNAVGITVAGDIVEGGFFDVIKAAAERLIPVLTKVSESIGPIMTKAIQDGVSSLRTLYVAFRDGVYAADGILSRSERLGGILHSLYAGVTALFTAFQTGIITSGGFTGTMELVGTALRTIADTLNSMLGPSLSALWNTIENELLPAWKKLWDMIGPGLLPAFGALAAIAGTVLVGALYVLINALNNIISVSSWLIGMFDRLRDVFIKNSEIIVGAFTGMAMNIISPFKLAFSTIAQLWNATFAKMNFTVPDWVPEFGGRGFKIPSIPGFAQGGFTGRGSATDVAGLVHRGEYVIPKSQVNQDTGKPELGSTFNMYGNVNLGSAGAVDRFFERLNAQKEMGALGAGV